MGVSLRVGMVKIFFKGAIPFSVVFFGAIPARWRPRIYHAKLFGKDFTISQGETSTFINHVMEVVSANQYHIELVNGSVVDAGANMGIFSIFAAVKHPATTIYAFEPTPRTFAALKENTKHYPNIKVFNFGLGDKNELSSIIETGDSGGNYIGAGGIPIEIKTIDSFNLKMNFLKMDTEGYEANILKGAAETIKKYKPIIAMSAYHKPNDKKELPELLNGITPYDCEFRQDCEENLICKPK